MTRITWNRTTGTYTVSNGTVKVINIPVKSQADCVKIDLRNGFEPSFGEVVDK